MENEELDGIIKEIESVGDIARKYFYSASVKNEQKADDSVVTEVDEEIEKQLVKYIQNNFPNDSIIGEEGDDVVGDSGYKWWIDPIDGTGNFLRRIPFSAISVARLGETAENSFGVVHNPITQQTFSSHMDGGMYENENLHRINSLNLDGHGIISIGRGNEEWMKSADYNLRKSLGEKFGRGASYGCCALELAYVAANRIDGVLIIGLNPYDYAAGLYLVRASGGLISFHNNEGWKRWDGGIGQLCDKDMKYIFASHPGLHDEVLNLVEHPKQWADS